MLSQDNCKILLRLSQDIVGYAGVWACVGPCRAVRPIGVGGQARRPCALPKCSTAIHVFRDPRPGLTQDLLRTRFWAKLRTVKILGGSEQRASIYCSARPTCKVKGAVEKVPRGACAMAQ